MRVARYWCSMNRIRVTDHRSGSWRSNLEWYWFRLQTGQTSYQGSINFWVNVNHQHNQQQEQQDRVFHCEPWKKTIHIKVKSERCSERHINESFQFGQKNICFEVWVWVKTAMKTRCPSWYETRCLATWKRGRHWAEIGVEAGCFFAQMWFPLFLASFLSLFPYYQLAS